MGQSLAHPKKNLEKKNRTHLKNCLIYFFLWYFNFLAGEWLVNFSYVGKKKTSDFLFFQTAGKKKDEFLQKRVCE